MCWCFCCLPVCHAKCCWSSFVVSCSFSFLFVHKQTMDASQLRCLNQRATNCSEACCGHAFLPFGLCWVEVSLLGTTRLCDMVGNDGCSRRGSESREGADRGGRRHSRELFSETCGTNGKTRKPPPPAIREYTVYIRVHQSTDFLEGHLVIEY